MARFADLRFPTTRDEEWRFTNVTPIINVPFRTAHGGDRPVITPAQLAPFIVGDETWSRLVFVNGRYSADLSAIASLPAGVRVANLAEAVQTDPELVRMHLGMHLRAEEGAFTALNTAFVNDGAFIHLPKETSLDAPIHILYLTVPGDDPVVSHPRTLIVADRNSRGEIIESFGSVGEGVYFTNAICEAVLAEGAQVKRYKIQEESDGAYHISSTHAHQNRESHFTSVSVSVGAEIARNDLDAVLDGEGSECVLDGLYLVHSGQTADNHLAVDHAKPHCNSHQLYKGILDGTGRAVFNGKIVVRQDAQRTDAKQTNRNLLLSEGAVIDTKPQLEIFADDVKCTHGATVGQLDEDAIFYLNSRGLSRGTARTILTYAFAADLVERIGIEPLRIYVNRILLEKLHVQPQAIEIL
jgi:Fe-S cluster assembly protein SufD